MPRRLLLLATVAAVVLTALAALPAAPAGSPLAAGSLDATGLCPAGLEAGAAARTVTPVGPDGRIWQEPYEDANGNGRYDAPNPLDPTAHFDPFTDENLNGKWDGPYMAGYGHDDDYYTARGVHDDVWARVIVLRCGGVTVAMASLDVVGLFIDEVRVIREAVADLGLTYVVVASTHTHDSIDTMGLWGPHQLEDGKDPRTMQHIREQTEAAIRDAHARLTPVTVRLGAVAAPIDFGFLQTDLRDPFVIDDVILTAVFERADGSGAEATLVNWSPHPETMAGTDDLISSDFPHTLRGCIEGTATSVPCVVRGKHYAGIGGTAVYFSGAVGGMMTTLRTRVFDESGERIPDYTYEKHERIGEIAAAAALDSVAHAPRETVRELRVQMREIFVPVDNPFLMAINTIGVLDHSASWGPGLDSPALGPTGVVAPAPWLKSEVAAVTLGAAAAPRAQVAMIPGEVLPEIAVGGFLLPTDDCWRENAEKARVNGGSGRERQAAANPQVPPEPVLRDHMKAEYKFLFGLANDELGYIVPANDFTPATLYPVYSYGTDRCGDDDHYEETVSASSHLAPAVANALASLVDPDFVPPPQANAYFGFTDTDGRDQGSAVGVGTTRGVWVDTNQNGAYEQHEDAHVGVGALAGFTGSWGFVDANGNDMGANPLGIPGQDPRGIWVDTDGDGQYAPGRDGVVFADAGPLGDTAMRETWP